MKKYYEEKDGSAVKLKKESPSKLGENLCMHMKRVDGLICHCKDQFKKQPEFRITRNKIFAKTCSRNPGENLLRAMAEGCEQPHVARDFILESPRSKYLEDFRKKMQGPNLDELLQDSVLGKNKDSGFLVRTKD